MKPMFKARNSAVLGTVLGLAVLVLSAVVSSLPAQEKDECKIAAGSSPPPPSVVHFDVGSTELKGESREIVVTTAKRYAGNPNFKVCLTGQADKEGDEEYNKQLALKRAQAVADLMVQNGVKASQTVVRARGEAFTDTVLEFLSPQDTDRRVEIKILSN